MRVIFSIIIIGVIKRWTGLSGYEVATLLFAFFGVIMALEKWAGGGQVWRWFKSQINFKRKLIEAVTGLQKDQTEIKGVVNVVNERQILIFGRQKAMYNAIDKAIFIVDKHGMLIYVNPKWCERMNVEDCNTVLKMGWVSLIPSEHRGQMVADHLRMIENPVPFRGNVPMITDRDKNEITIFKVITDVIYDGDEFIEIVGSLDEI